MLEAVVCYPGESSLVLDDGILEETIYTVEESFNLYAELEQLLGPRCITAVHKAAELEMEPVSWGEARLDLKWLASRYPVLSHMAEDGSWESIRERGLLSTTALLDLFAVDGERRRALESARRPEMATVEHPELGTALVRDNKPMQEKVLLRCLKGMTPREWYEHLNRRVFFWVEKKRLLRLLDARAYRDRLHLVLEVDTAALLRCNADRVKLSPINSGATFAMSPAPRGPDTFRRIADHPDGKPVVELTVDYAVFDIVDLILMVSRWRGGEKLAEVWRRPAR